MEASMQVCEGFGESGFRVKKSENRKRTRKGVGELANCYGGVRAGYEKTRGDPEPR